MEEKKLILQPRLQALSQLVPDGARMADIGTDHGYLPVYLLQEGKITFAIASDINREPLEHARRTALEYHITEHIDFRLCGGLDLIEPHEVDTVVVAGMGGETIAAILSAAPWLMKSEITLLLQPMSK
ncbi:MAG: SAM-dependent methyltransferase, partial [Oscillospiraceae bacterium]|nr:SAM-dependent methyltransferase [Oscillospiraceae bacterium]